MASLLPQSPTAISNFTSRPHPRRHHSPPLQAPYRDMQKLAKVANRSHRDRIQDFNQSLANLSEHYDIPKVGPG